MAKLFGSLKRRTGSGMISEWLLLKHALPHRTLQRPTAAVQKLRSMPKVLLVMALVVLRRRPNERRACNGFVAGSRVTNNIRGLEGYRGEGMPP
jgi:hypothetical protein